MKYQLGTLEKLTAETLNPAMLQANSVNVAVIKEAANIFFNEKERLRKVFIKAAYKCREQHVFGLYIMHHQRDLIRFSNIIYQYQQSGTNTIIQSVYHDCMNNIETLLATMLNDFNEYFDHNCIVTDFYRNNTQSLIKQYSTALQKHLSEINIEEALQQIIVTVFEAYHTDKNTCTYQRCFYLEKLYNKLMIVKDKDSVIQCLYEMNFNSIQFFAYSTQQIKTLVAANAKNETAALLLASFTKENNQRMVLSDLALYPGEISIKKMMGNWLNEELYFLELQEPKVIYGTQPLKKGKIKINLSVDALAYFLYLMEESGMVAATVKKQIFELVANACSSKEQTHIAYRSLQNSSYDISHYTKTKVKDVLIKMLNVVNRKE